ncbi:MAG TPA: site-specific DNA-methyltransferase [Pantanalinema sp.]
MRHDLVTIKHLDCIAFLRELPADSVDVITTDPAYSGMNQHLKLGRGRIVGRYGDASDPRWFKEFADDPITYRAFLAECARVLKPDRHLYLMFDSFSLLSLGALVREHFAVKNLIVWDKRSIGMGHYFRRRHEHIVFAAKGNRKLSRRDIPDVWTFSRLTRAKYPTQKPVELFEAMLAGSAEPGFVVCDPFVGSGSAAIAALRHGCSFVGADIAERAVAFARERVAAFLASGIDPGQAPQKERPPYLGPLNDVTGEA